MQHSVDVSVNTKVGWRDTRKDGYTVESMVKPMVMLRAVWMATLMAALMENTLAVLKAVSWGSLRVDRKASSMVYSKAVVMALPLVPSMANQKVLY